MVQTLNVETFTIGLDAESISPNIHFYCDAFAFVNVAIDGKIFVIDFVNFVASLKVNIVA